MSRRRSGALRRAFVVGAVTACCCAVAVGASRSAARPTAAATPAATFALGANGSPTSGLTARGATGSVSLRALAADRGLLLGAVVDPVRLATDADYAAAAAAQVSLLAPRDAFAWPTAQPRPGTQRLGEAGAVARFAAVHGQLVAAGPLVDHDALPAWLPDAGSAASARQVRADVKQRVSGTVARFVGTVGSWDVVADAFVDGAGRADAVTRALGGLGAADLYRWAHDADPTAPLYYADHGLAAPGPQADAVYAFLKHLRRQGVPVDGVRFLLDGTTTVSPEQLRGNLQRFADLGLDVAVTVSDPDQAPAALAACLEVSGCASFTVPSPEQDLDPQVSALRQVLQDAASRAEQAGAPVGG